MTVDVFLLLAMGLAGAALVVHWARRAQLRPSHPSTAAGVVWWLVCCAPLVILQSSGGGGLISGPVDFAGAAALHLSMFGFVLGARRRGVSEAAPGSGVDTGPRRPGSVNLAWIILAWPLWLVAMDGRISDYTVGIVANCIAAAVGAVCAASAAALLRRRRPGAVALLATVAGLAAASAGAASVSVAAAAATGVVAGSLADAIMGRSAKEGTALVEVLIGYAGIGASSGLLAVGLLDDRAGFLITGQPTLLIGQGLLVLTAFLPPLAAGRAIRALFWRERASAKDEASRKHGAT